jgi:hypothetical protein
MATVFLKYRASLTPTVPVSDNLYSGPGTSGLTNLEIDGNFHALKLAVNTKADLASPTFTGVPVVPTASVGTSTTQAASTEFAQQAASDAALAMAIALG